MRKHFAYFYVRIYYNQLNFNQKSKHNSNISIILNKGRTQLKQTNLSFGMDISFHFESLVFHLKV